MKTVADLIKELQELPQDAEACVMMWKPPNYIVKEFVPLHYYIDNEGTNAERIAGATIPKRVVFQAF